MLDESIKVSIKGGPVELLKVIMNQEIQVSVLARMTEVFD